MLATPAARHTSCSSHQMLATPNARHTRCAPHQLPQLHSDRLQLCMQLPVNRVVAWCASLLAMRQDQGSIPVVTLRAPAGSKLTDLINTNSLQQHVSKPTRWNNILDLVMTTSDLRIIRLEVTDKIGDHHMIDLALKVHDPNTRTQQNKVLDYKRTNFELMKEELGSTDYEVLMRNKNA
ncbi:hypothetical protein FHG87_015149 [Trinorchestia longiramus]|nr:hypothetical protein FHG87_015149 [Trinorchestia longiramus]